MAARDDLAQATTWPGALPFPGGLVRQVIARHAPVIRFHPDGPYFPASVEWYLARSLLIGGVTGAVIARHPAAADLPKGPATAAALPRFWLTLDPDIAGPALEPDPTSPGDP